MSQPTFQPTDSGFHDAVTRSRRRRTRRHAVAASASGTALAVAAFAVLSGQPGTPDSLQQRPIGPAVAPDAGPLPTTATSPGTAGEPAPTPQARRSPARGPQTAPGREEPAEPGADPGGGSPPVPDTPDRVLVSTPARLTTSSYQPNVPCADTSGRAATGWCMQTDLPRSGVTGRPVDLAVSLCRLPGFGRARASFPSTAEAGFALLEGSGGGTPWDHARQHPGRPGRHERQVEPGRCLTWTVTWTNRRDDGEPVAPGSYELRLSVLSDNTAGPNTAVTQTYAYDVESEP